MRLPDGRTLAVEEFGDPAGWPVLYFHGFPACRLEAGLLPDLPVRLLAFDRPGYGGSTSHPGRRLVDWPADVAHVADWLGLDRFHIVGLSGGGPYAAACAALLGRRVESLSLVCPVPPVGELSKGGLSKEHGGLGDLIAFGRQPRRAAMVFPLVRMMVRQRLFSIRHLLGRGLGEADQAALTRDVRERLIGVWAEALKFSIQGALSDARIYASDWGFDLGAIEVPTAVWCGGQDRLIPVSTLAPYRAIPGAVWHVLEDEGHFSLPLRHGAAMVAELLSRPPGKAAEHG